MKTDLYFDYAAATPLDPDIFEVMMPYFSAEFYNPSALYNDAQKVRAAINDSRKNVAKVLEVKSSEIIFTSGCTEANNLAVLGVMKLYPEAKMLISAIEHDSVRGPASHCNVTEIKTDKRGRLDYNDLEKNLTDDVVLVSVILANNEIGVVQDLARISEVIDIARKARTNGLPLYLHTDAAQAANYIALRPHTLGVDMLSLNGTKMYGPKGSGCLYIASHCKISPVLSGGGQERGLRSGTENVPGIVGFAAAFCRAQERHIEESKRLVPIRDFIMDKCISIGGTINGDRVGRLPNSISVTFPGADNEGLLYALDNKGIHIATGSACHASNGEKSHVLRAIGLSDNEAKSTVRISIGRGTTMEGAHRLMNALTEVLAK